MLKAYDYNGNKIKTVEIQNELFFNTVDILRALGYKPTAKQRIFRYLAKVPESDKQCLYREWHVKLSSLDVFIAVLRHAVNPMDFIEWVYKNFYPQEQKETQPVGKLESEQMLAPQVLEEFFTSGNELPKKGEN